MSASNRRNTSLENREPESPGATRTSAVTRSGQVSAKSMDVRPPKEWPTNAARVTRRLSRSTRRSLWSEKGTLSLCDKP
jgi:hypothetical protein